MKAANVDANGRQPVTWIPTAAAIICCSAMYISKYRSGTASRKISANVEFETSPSRPTTSSRAKPTAASASPYALRVATSLPTSYVGSSGVRRSISAARPLSSGRATSIRMFRMPPSSSIASSGLSSALPCQPGWFSTAFTPLPFSVRATTIAGLSTASASS
jgi:hypothetical protein